MNKCQFSALFGNLAKNGNNSAIIYVLNLAIHNHANTGTTNPTIDIKAFICSYFVHRYDGYLVKSRLIILDTLL